MATIHESLEAFVHDAFRLEAMPHYQVVDEDRALEEFLNGRSPHLVGDRAHWLEFVRTSASTARRIRRVRVIDEPPTDYQRFQLGWEYFQHVEAGEEIRTLPRAEICTSQTAPCDFWLFDDRCGFTVVHDYRGRMLGARELTSLGVERCREVRDRTLARSRPFPSGES